MKRSFFLILAAMVLLATVFTLLPASPSPVSAAVNLIRNPGFEAPTGDGNQSPAYWTYPFTTTSPYRDFTNLHSGNCSAYLHGASGYYEQIVSNIVADTIYRFEAYTKANADGNETVTLTIRNSSGGVLDTHSWHGTDHGWARRIGYLTTPVNAWDAVITLAISGDAAAEAWFDDILLEERMPPGWPSGCFIATAAYGTATAEQIDVLRAFRDQVLLQSALGSQFVAWYYQASPPVADFISENSLLRTVVRELLIDPMVGLARLTQGLWGD